MKKIYVIPTIHVDSILPEEMLAASPGYGGTTDEESGNLSRQGGYSHHTNDVWGGEEDEEF